jgi:DNA invertase Pin-like site-specific DNA recombinase
MSYNVAIYARHSPDCTASAEDQVDRLKAIAVQRGWTVTHVFTDRPATVKKDRRPGETALLSAIRSSGVERVLLYGIDRVGRTLVDLVSFVETCRSSDVGLYLHEQGIDTTNPDGKSLFDVAGMLAFHLRQMRRDRILRGQAAARSVAVRFGRPKLTDIKPGKVERAKQALAEGTPVRRVARMTGISPASISRLKSSLASASAT